MSSPFLPHRLDDDGRPAGRGTRVPHLARLLAIHGARQQAGPTARLMREGNPPQLDGDEAARLLILFAQQAEGGDIAARWAAGSFHRGVASLLEAGKI